MKLSRRDALAALAATGLTGAAVYVTGVGDDDEPATDEGASTDGPNGVVRTTTALAPVLYPSEVTDAEEFVRTYVTGRIEADDDHRDGMADAVDALDGYADDEFGARFSELSADEGDQLLTDLGLERVRPDPEGSDTERIRFYLVNELLYALFSSPTGGELVGTENPPGHPGGLESYQGAQR